MDTTKKIKIAFALPGIILIAIALILLGKCFALVKASNGLYSGTIYTGVFAIICGIRGLILPKHRSIGYLIITCVISFIVAIIGAALSGIIYQFYQNNNIATCASYAPALDGNCVIYNSTTATINSPSFNCYGNSNYNALAIYCEAIDINYSCSCVDFNTNTENQSECIYFAGVSDCNNILGDYTSLLQSIYVLTLVILFISMVYGAFASYVYNSPTSFDSEMSYNYNENNGNGNVQTEVPTIVVSSTTATPVSGSVVSVNPIREHELQTITPQNREENVIGIVIEN